MSAIRITRRARRSVSARSAVRNVTSLLAEVSGYALRAQWFQKYWVHRALRPEAYGGLVHYTKTAAASYPLHSDVLNSQALAGIFEKNNGTYFLPIAFPEGSPTHPSYGSGHATVAGACVTVLKAFFNTDNVAFPNPMVSRSGRPVPHVLHGSGCRPDHAHW